MRREISTQYYHTFSHNDFHRITFVPQSLCSWGPAKQLHNCNSSAVVVINSYSVLLKVLNLRKKSNIWNKKPKNNHIRNFVFRISFMLPHPQSASASPHLGQNMAELHIPYSNLFTARPQQTPKYRCTPMASASAFYLLMAGRNCFQWQRCYLLAVRQSGVAVCAGSRWEEARWPLSPALISYSSWKLMTLVLSHYGKHEEGLTVCGSPMLNFSCSHLWRIHFEHLLEWLKVMLCCSCLILWHLSVWFSSIVV